jgi:hyperosmotically inducible protein
MRRIDPTIALPVCLLLAGCADQPGMQRVDQPDASTPNAVDDTGRNARDRTGETLTPLDQSSDESDVKITQELRRSITGDASLSINAHNVKVITNDGVVTLRGPVQSDDERAMIERKAREISGVARVDSQLEVSRQ